MKWDGVSSVLRILLVLVLLFLFGPFLVELLYSGNHHTNARRASCASNLKQLGMAMTEYAQDNNGALPAANSTVDVDGGTVTWRDRTYPYVKSAGAYQCPDDVRDSRSSSTALPSSYGANNIGLDATGKERGVFPLNGEASVSLASMPIPSQTISLADARGNVGGEWNIVSPAFLPTTGRELYVHVPRHIFYEHPGGTINLLFADGHVKSLKPAATLSPVNLWTRDNTPFTGQDLQNAQAILKHAEDE